MADLRPDQVPELWWTSYAAAERVGLATEVELPGGPQLDVLLVTGLSDLDPRDAFAAHAGHGDLGVVAPMSPSNTVAGQPAADLGRDPATWLEVARAGGSGTAAGLSGVLTGAPRLDGVPAADTALLDVVPTLVTALWPVLWQRWLKDVEHAAQVYELGDWAARVLSPLGPFPALRVGSVPYGVLPAVDPAAWAPGPQDPVWEEAVTLVASRVLSPWAAAGAAGGTAAGADAERLLDIIGRVPTSRALGSRQFPPLEALALFMAVVNGIPARGGGGVGGDGRTGARRRAAAAPPLPVLRAGAARRARAGERARVPRALPRGAGRVARVRRAARGSRRIRRCSCGCCATACC